jgi:hypothetical protein
VTDELTIRRSELGALDYLGKGGTAIVYSAPQLSIDGASQVVYKEYKASTRAAAGPGLFAGLRSLVVFHQRLDANLRPRWDERIIWPLRLVVPDDNPTEALGVVMRRIPARYFQRVVSRTSGEISTSPREVDSLFGDSADMARIGYGPVDVRGRLALIGRISAVYAMMHRQKVVVGDVSGRNVIYEAATASPTVLVVDADSCRIVGTASAFGNQPQTPFWEPPEALRAARNLVAATRSGQRLSASDHSGLVNRTSVQSTMTDVYKFGLMVVRILDHGRRRATNRDPHNAARLLRSHAGREGEELLLRSLSEDPSDRPSIRKWYELTHGGQTTSASIPSQSIGTTPPATSTEPPDGQVNGAWRYVRGTGWVRTRRGKPGP